MAVSRPWHQHYPDHVAPELESFPYETVRDLFESACDRFADDLAFASGSLRLTYGQVAAYSADFGAFLAATLGVGKGDRVAVMTPNILAFPIAMFGNIRIGAPQVNVNPMYTPHELEHQLNDAGVKVIVAFDGSCPTLAKVIDKTSIETVIVAGAGDPFTPAGQLPDLGDSVRCYSFAEALAAGSASRCPRPDLSGDDLLFLQYTGGTTGLSKGAMLSHHNLVANIAQTAILLEDETRTEREVVLTAIPLYHIFALMVNTLSYFDRGGANVLIANPRDMVGFVEEWGRWPVTVFTGVNTLYNGLLHTPGFDELDFSTLYDCVGGGAPVQQAVSDKWKSITGQHIREGYGLSETSPVVTFTPRDLPEFRCSIGIPVPSTDVSLRDDDGNEVPQGDRGELCVKGPQVMLGYYNRPEATAEVMTDDGYFRTGDIATMDPDGYLHIVDRKKDMILVSGFNVYPNEIEAAAAFMPGIVEAACVGVPDDRTGEAARLFVVRTEPISGDKQIPDEEQIKAFLRERLTPYKTPRDVVFLDELPRSTVGKILRRELRDWAG